MVKLFRRGERERVEEKELGKRKYAEKVILGRQKREREKKRIEIDYSPFSFTFKMKLFPLLFCL